MRMPLILGLGYLVLTAPAAAATSEVCKLRPSTTAQRAAQERMISVDREKGYGFEETATDVFIGTDGNFSMGVVVTEEGVVLVDAPTSMGSVIETMVAEIADAPITHVVYSHAHSDHIGGAAELTGPFEVVASRPTEAELEKFNRLNRQYPFGTFVDGTGAVPMPTMVIGSETDLRVGGRTIRLEPLQTGHSQGDMLAYVPEARTMIAIDVTWPASVPWVRLGDADNVPGYMAQNERLLDYDFEHLIAGHFAIVGNRGDVENNIEYLEDLRREGIAALRGTNAGEIAAETGLTNAYTLMDEYFQRTVDKAAAPVIEKWRDRLMGAGVWSCQHAQWMISSLRYDQLPE